MPTLVERHTTRPAQDTGRGAQDTGQVQMRGDGAGLGDVRVVLGHIQPRQGVDGIAEPVWEERGQV